MGLFEKINVNLEPIIGSIGKAIEKIGANVTGALLLLFLIGNVWQFVMAQKDRNDFVPKWNFDRVVSERDLKDSLLEICQNEHERYIQDRLDRLEGIERNQKKIEKKIDTIATIIKP